MNISTVTISIQIEKVHRWRAWDSNPGSQDTRRRRNRGAMAVQLLGRSSSFNGPFVLRSVAGMVSSIKAQNSFLTLTNGAVNYC